MTTIEESRATRVKSDDAPNSFTNLEDRGTVLFVRIKRPAGGAVPVLISRDALEEHFGAGQRLAEQSDACDAPDKDLSQAYVANHSSINAQALALDTGGDIYTSAAPMLLGCGDFK